MKIDIPDILAYAIIDSLYSSTHKNAASALHWFEKIVSNAAIEQPKEHVVPKKTNLRGKKDNAID